MDYEQLINIVSVLFEAAGVKVMVLGAIISSAVFIVDWATRRDFKHEFNYYRQNLGRAILLGLDFLIIGDIIHSVIVSESFQNVGILATIIAIRFFLGAELEHRIDGVWPWERRKRE